jgi:hypothetical protein
VPNPLVTRIADDYRHRVAPALVDAAKLTLNHDERQAFVSACKKVANARLVTTLATMLVPTQQDIWWYAVDALIKTDTDDAARALQPHLLQETNLERKLEIAESVLSFV